MRRRDFITLLGGAAGAWPFGARGQQLRRVGVLLGAYSQGDREGQANIAGFLGTFQRLGWTDGRNIKIEYRWGAGDADRIKALAAELVRSAPDALVVSSSQALAEIQRLTSTIPIVFAQIGDPVGTGFVAGLARPGGNLTGFQTFDVAIGGKWLGLLKEAAPNLSRAAVLFNSQTAPSIAQLRAAEAVAPSLGVTVSAVESNDGGEIERAVAAFAGRPNGGLMVAPNPYILANRTSIIILAARHRLPAIYPYRFFATEGGLISYGPDLVDQYRGAATYVDRILKGDKPSDLPIQAPTKYELVVNMKTAKALGLDIAPGLPLRADEVIE
jgi:putative ABC transport system substrate-binding protein